MVAHKANYQRMAHRTLPPEGGDAVSVLAGSLPSAVDLVPVAGKVILSLEGGRHRDFEAAEHYLQGQNLEWQIIFNTDVTSYKQALLRALEQCKSPLVAIVPPWCEIKDPLWVQRMRWPMEKDQLTLLCTTGEEQGPAKDLAPFVATPRRWPGGEIIFARRVELTALLTLIQDESFYETLAKDAAAASWHIWCHPGIRFNLHPHEPHEPKSKSRAQSQRRPAGSNHG
jgi:hypothetical protein